MKTDYSVGDKLICLKDIIYNDIKIFTAGEYYSIKNIGEVYYIVDNVSFYKNTFNNYFGNLKQYRNLKLKKLNSYERW